VARGGSEAPPLAARLVSRVLSSCDRDIFRIECFLLLLMRLIFHKLSLSRFVNLTIVTSHHNQGDTTTNNGVPCKRRSLTTRAPALRARAQAIIETITVHLCAEACWEEPGSSLELVKREPSNTTRVDIFRAPDAAPCD
jgi:hypothetical protein